MKIKETQTITIAGAGLAGTLLAVLLGQRGLRVALYERNPDQRFDEAPAGRSINLALAERGREALRMAGLLEAVDDFTIPMRGRMLHDLDGELVLQPYGASEDEVIWSTHRALLNSTLLDAAEATGQVEIHFNHAVDEVDWDAKRIRFMDGDTAGFEVLVGADGGGSAVRHAMQRVQDIGVSEELLDHGYRELTIPAAEDGGFAMDPNALHIWPRGGFMLIALPNSDGSFTVTLFLANRGAPSFDSLREWPVQEHFCRSQFPDAFPLMSWLREDFEENPVGLLGTVRCRQWHLDGIAVLLGDAAHAVVPFHGQGMNAAFEDCIELAGLVEDGERDWADVFSEFQRNRIDNANAIADMALENYAIMREAVRDPGFLVRKALEHELERRFGDRFIGRYSLVMFHRLPYAEVYQRGQVQEKLLDGLLEGVESLTDVDFEAAGRLIADQLEPIQGV
jgi:kynurenine 3-monooxygenase